MASPTGLWTSVSGSMAQSQAIDTIANNIANANTVGFKKDESTFKEYLTVNERAQDPVIDVPRTVFKDSDFYHFDGRENAMVNLDRIHTDHTQGSFKNTNAPFDLAIDGPGFFAVQTTAGMRFTRAGDFKMNAQGQLVTSEGFAVLGLTAAPATPATSTPSGTPNGGENSAAQAAPNPFAAATDRSIASSEPQEPNKPGLKPIVVASENAKVRIQADGQIYAGEDLLGTLVLAEFPETKSLRKIGSNLYENPDPANVPLPAKSSRLHQGFLEQSNVNSVSELVNLIRANRMFEGNMRAIKVYNDMAGKEANEVGKL